MANTLQDSGTIRLPNDEAFAEHVNAVGADVDLASIDLASEIPKPIDTKPRRVEEDVCADPNHAFDDPKVNENAHESDDASDADSNQEPSLPTGRFEKRAGNTIAFLTSLVTHVLLLLLLASWMYVAGKPSQGLLLSAEVGTSQDTSLDVMQSFELSPQVGELETTEVQLESPELSLDFDIKADFEVPKPLGNSGISSTLTSLTVGDVVQNIQAKVNDGRGASFFGAYAEGKRFVYVLDSSRSMLGDRWEYACHQLIDSLTGLKEGQEFFIICFDLETTLLFNATPNQAQFYPADNEMVKKVRNWLRSRTLGRATKPAMALTFALNLNPDAIFLLSDGELQDNSQMMLRQMNGTQFERRQIPIHTVHLFSMQGRFTLQRIALENGGTFTPIEGAIPFGGFRRR